MDLHYPNGKKYVQMETVKKKATLPKNISYSNRGMTLESDLNETNLYYLEQGIAVIHKKPTPVQIVQVDYKSRSTAVIKEAYFKQPSTTDYNGVYRGRYIDFEAKETQNITSFPLQNFHAHQIEHMKRIVEQNGICFVILRFAKSEDIFLLESQYLFKFWDRMVLGGRKSIKKVEIEEVGHKISLGIQPRIDYINIINHLYHFGETNS
ncbi:Holliday junction resolvase [Heyndrickxia shackletonii]|uniref:Holliday junction resolvase RecU n=1 Tax=Heyndrickxia shackletonii TaxID=157838 RepID=A0A0Q3WX87_9BACI|nr:Holliday junction resolvase RecU [Heyndrickxia shackletonii]KQL53738.1 Holliday junction resolvase [Heyndrickxia shackletonii]MBB2481697.1 Holliday junction resolvase RecU [Bacillus sp. APMAM]NEY99880.1 Holliday junction resolvase RecU [Heyndrickxia shackletonii]RTZ54985.1 Holliday junction resolvase RecU [Bacillus sp. SAJ1]